MSLRGFLVAAVAALALAGPAPAQQIIFNNTTTFTGFGYAPGSGLVGANQITFLDADDISVGTEFGGLDVTGMVFSTANFNGAAVSARPLVRFWATDGTAGAPGTFLGGVTFNPVSLTAGSVQLFTYTPGAAIFTIPANGQFWAGMNFDNNDGATGATAVQMDNVGQGLFTPPTVGSSVDRLYETTTFGDFTTSNPAGTVFDSPFGNNPAGNFGWQFSIAPVPEPASLFAVAACAGVWLRRRRAV